MKCLLGVAGIIVLLSPFAVATAQSVSVDEQVAQAVLPLPKDLRAGATVVTYDAATGARKVIRQGTNTLECEPMDPSDGFTRCYDNVVVPRRELEAKLRAEKKSEKEIRDAIAAAVQDGTIKAPPFGLMSYRLSSKDGVIKWLWVMSVPYATQESIGVSTVSQRDAALKGRGLPWLMLAGTAGAHVMIPMNRDE